MNLQRREQINQITHKIERLQVNLNYLHSLDALEQKQLEDSLKSNAPAHQKEEEK